MQRRNLLFGAVAATAMVGCTQTDLATIETQIASVITQIQSGVRKACASAGVLVPTADSVLQVLIGILGSTSVAGVTAVMIEQAINAIVAVCPAASPTNVPKAATPVTVQGKLVPVNWY